eukprot:14004662-Ditylum_brightwellii.AAC.1
MDYHMCTAKGVSEEKHCNSKEDSAYGSGQGTCDTGTKWNYTDSIITRAYNKKATGCEPVNPKQEICIKQNSVKFVDDNTLLHNLLQIDISLQTLMHHVQHNASLWGRYI